MKSMNFLQNIEAYLDKLKRVIGQLDPEQINTVLNQLVEVHQRGGYVYIFGNGGSAATASHFVNDFNKGISEKLARKFKFISLNDNFSTMMAIANDNGYDRIFIQQLENFLAPGDLVIGISGSGNSPNILRAIEYANSQGVDTIGLVGYDGGKLKQIVKCYIHVPVPDMQIVEDLHMVMDHLMMKVLKEYLEAL
jgi:D-sedoheptulose 7-phosphate isomerase